MTGSAISETAQAIEIPNEGPVYIQVVGPGQLRVGDDAAALQANVNEGIPFTVVTNNLPNCCLPSWQGKLYYIGNISNQNGGVPFSIQIPSIAVRRGQR
jgi:hypothetical protein